MKTYPTEIILNKPKILLSIDYPDWAFAHIANALKLYLSNQFDFEIRRFADIIDNPGDILYDAVVSFWGPGYLPLKKVVKSKAWIVGLFEFWSWQRHVDIRPAWEEVLKSVDFVAVANEPLMEEFRKELNTTIPMFVCEDGVDIDLFKPQSFPEEFTVGWTGNSQHGSFHGYKDLKGVSLIEEACNVAGVKLLKLDSNSSDIHIPHKDMPEKFYKNISVYVSASEVEGTPNTILEAAACCKPSIAIRNGGISRRLILDGVTGRLVPRNARAISEAICDVRANFNLSAAGIIARKAAIAHDWEYKAEYWRVLLTAAVTK